MTAPIGLPRAAVDPTMSIAPNASPAGASAAGDADAAAVAQFGAALTMMLSHMAKPVANPNAAMVNATDSADANGDDDAESADATPGTEASGAAAGAGMTTATGATTAQGSAALIANGAQISINTLVSSAGLESPAEKAADDVIGDALRQSVAAALANPIAANAPAIALAPNDIATTDTNTVRRDLDLLAPEFRDRLDRVIDRMESEFGYKVEVSETFRSQSRQDALFAQGRTQPGQVVTWTRASNHTAGRAADLVIDGTYDNPQAYDRLMRVAREEGLRTLGSRDPGHVELPSSSAGTFVRGSADDAPSVIAQPAPSVASLSSIVPSLQELESAPTSIDAKAAMMSGARVQGVVPQQAIVAQEQTAAPVAFVAPVARVAPVAQVAVVAQVAQVATVGAQAAPSVLPSSRQRAAEATGDRSPSVRRGDAASAKNGETPVVAVAPNASKGQSSSDDAGRRGASANDEKPARPRIEVSAARNDGTEIMRQSRDELMHAVGGSDPNAGVSSPTSSGDGTASIGHADMSERIARLLKVQDAASDRPMSQVMLRLERPDGGEDRLRVDLRGNTVSATLDVSDPAAADRMSANVKELQRSLERQGLQTDSLTIRTVTRPLESSTLSRAAGASVESDLQRPTSSSSSNNTSSRDRGTRHDEQQRPSPDSQRQRSRREQKGDR